jgi:hypothetical protein
MNFKVISNTAFSQPTEASANDIFFLLPPSDADALWSKLSPEHKRWFLAGRKRTYLEVMEFASRQIAAIEKQVSDLG